MNPQTGIQALFQSRRFVTALVDAVLTLALYFVGKYLALAIDDLKFLILVLQPIFVSVIGAFTVDDLHASSVQAQLQMHTNSLNNQMDIARLTVSK